LNRNVAAGTILDRCIVPCLARKKANEGAEPIPLRPFAPEGRLILFLGFSGFPVKQDSPRRRRVRRVVLIKDFFLRDLGVAMVQSPIPASLE